MINRANAKELLENESRMKYGDSILGGQTLKSSPYSSLKQELAKNEFGSDLYHIHGHFEELDDY
jgi:hypothetical protein